MNCPTCSYLLSCIVVGWDICGDIHVMYCEKCGWNEEDDIEERISKFEGECIYEDEREGNL